MPSAAETSWGRLVGRARGDPAVRGLVLTGGRGKGVHGPDSDWDAVLVVDRDAVAAWRQTAVESGPGVDLTVLSPEEFAEHGEPGTATAWRGYDLAHLVAVVDRGGVQDALNRKGRLSSEAARRLADDSVDSALNQLYRAAKGSAAGEVRASGLDLAEMVPPWLTAVFALEGRHRPYNKFLAWELTAHPLALRSLPAPELLAAPRTPRRSGTRAGWRLVAAPWPGTPADGPRRRRAAAAGTAPGCQGSRRLQ